MSHREDTTACHAHVCQQYRTCCTVSLDAMSQTGAGPTTGQRWASVSDAGPSLSRRSATVTVSGLMLSMPSSRVRQYRAQIMRGAYRTLAVQSLQETAGGTGRRDEQWAYMPRQTGQSRQWLVNDTNQIAHHHNSLPWVMQLKPED